MACQNCNCQCLAYAYFNMLPNGCPCPVPINPCEDEESCLKLANLFVASEDSVGPCTEAGTVTWPTDCFDYTGCGESNPSFRIYDISDPDLLTVQSIDHTHMDFTALPGSEGKAITIIIEAWCGSLRAYGSVTIVIQNPCTVCPAGFACNPCEDAVCVSLTGGPYEANGPHDTSTEVIGTETAARVYTVESYDENVLENVAVNGSGQLSYDVICNAEALPTSTIVRLKIDASGAIDYLDVVINIDLCDGVSCDTCEYCDPCDGLCKAYPAKTVTITGVSPSGLVTSEAIDTDEVITYTPVCIEHLPAPVIFTYSVVECGITTVKTQEIEIPCPASCCECPKLSEGSSNNCTGTIDVTTGKQTGCTDCTKIPTNPPSGDFTVNDSC